MKWQQCSVLSVLAKPVEADRERERGCNLDSPGISWSFTALWGEWPGLVSTGRLTAREATQAIVDQWEDRQTLGWPMRSQTDRRARCWSEHQAWGAGRDVTGGAGWGRAETKHSVPCHTCNMSHWWERWYWTVMAWQHLTHVSHVLPRLSAEMSSGSGAASGLW